MEPDDVQPSPRAAVRTPKSGDGVRKHVLMPRTLPELQQQAALHLGVEGRMRFFHKEGDGEIHHARKLEAVEHDDTILVSTGRRRNDDGPTVRSTHQSDFIAHPPQTPVPPMGDDSLSTLSEQAKRAKMWDGSSLYKKDYVRHPVQRGPFVTGADAFKTNIPQLDAASYYKTSNLEHYPWRPVAERDKVATDIKASLGRSVLTQATKGKPFQGKSNYAADYDTRYRGRPDPAVATCTDATSTLTEAVMASPFEGKSSYDDHFVKHPLTGRQPSARPVQGQQRVRTFDGQSEYHHKYNTQPMSARGRLQKCCHLERAID